MTRVLTLDLKDTLRTQRTPKASEWAVQAQHRHYLPYRRRNRRAERLPQQRRQACDTAAAPSS